MESNFTKLYKELISRLFKKIFWQWNNTKINSSPELMPAYLNNSSLFTQKGVRMANMFGRKQLQTFITRMLK